MLITYPSLRIQILSFLLIATLISGCRNQNDPIFTHDEVMQYIPKGPAKCFRQICLETNSNVRGGFPSDSVFKTFLSQYDPVKYGEFCTKINLDAALVLSLPESGYAAYRQTKINALYPGMKGDFFGETLKELHKRGISCFAYICIGWVKKYSFEHPEYVDYQWENNDTPLICLNSPYRDRIIESSREILSNYPIDGIRYDILDQQTKCRCDGCRKLYREIFNDTMPDAWIDWQHQQKFRLVSISHIVKDLYSACKAVKPSVPVWQNWFDGQQYADIADVNSVDMAYLEFADPFRLLFLNGVFNKEGIITGKVIENPKTRWKCLAMGGKCYSYFRTDNRTGMPIDDKENKQWLDNELSPFYAQVREAEPYLQNTTPVTNIAIVYNEKTRYHFEQFERDNYMKVLRDITEPLLSSGNPVRFISNVNLTTTPLKPYNAILLPESSGFSAEQLETLKNYSHEGGNLIVLGDALSYTEEGLPEPNFDLSEMMGISREGKPEAFNKIDTTQSTGKEQQLMREIISNGTTPAKIYPNTKQFTPVRVKTGQTLSFLKTETSKQPLVHLNPYGKGFAYYIASSKMPEVTAAVLNYAGVLSPVKNDNLSGLVILTKKNGSDEWILHLLDKGKYSLTIDKKYCHASKISSTFPIGLKNIQLRDSKESIVIEVNNENDYGAIVLK
jgi:Hypothetical glycosyl hydrolase 6/Beta-galactosidase trimerisation domain